MPLQAQPGVLNLQPLRPSGIAHGTQSTWHRGAWRLTNPNLSLAMIATDPGMCTRAIDTITGQSFAQTLTKVASRSGVVSCRLLTAAAAPAKPATWWPSPFTLTHPHRSPHSGSTTFSDIKQTSAILLPLLSHSPTGAPRRCEFIAMRNFPQTDQFLALFPSA